MVYQTALFNASALFATHLEFRLSPETQLVALLNKLSQVLNQHESVQWMLAVGGQWVSSLPEPYQPDGYRPFNRLESESYVAPESQMDLLIRVQGLRQDQVFDAVLAVSDAMLPYGKLWLEQPCFSYHHSLDLMAFEDGTANPKGSEDQEKAALIPEGRPGAGGSFILTQRWVHRLSSFKALSTQDQEQVIGRTKDTNEELSGDNMPKNAHVARTDLSDESGQGIKVWRQSMPFGTSERKGLYFMSFASDLSKHQHQLESMYGYADGITDRILEFSEPDSGAYWFMPPASFFNT